MHKKADRFAQIIGSVPFVKNVTLTGSRAEGKAAPQSDIDFFVQVAPGRLYLTRLLVTALVHLTGQRRHGPHITGRICLNWFATFDGPKKQGRRHQVLWRRPSPKKTGAEKWLSNRLGNFLEQLARSIQQARFKSDPRSHLPGSQVRFTDTELGFHPPKTLKPSTSLGINPRPAEGVDKQP